MNILRRIFGTPKSQRPSSRAPKPTAADLGLKFIRLNYGWDAYPNGAKIETEIRNKRLITRFPPNAYQFSGYSDVSLITLSFENCARFRITALNDHGYYLGQCRFSGVAPAWGAFYEIQGDTRDAQDPTPWSLVGGLGTRHFHFYQRDCTLEVKASNWHMQTGDP